MPTRSASAPTDYSVQFKGHTYLSYQGVIGGITGEGPVQVAKVAGAIVRTADGATWEPVFIGDVAPPANYRMPGLLWALDDTLYCVMVEGSRSSLLPLSYVGPGEIAIWTSPNGLTWTKHQVLVTWTAHGTGSFEGGNASELTFRVQSQWRAQGSGPAGAAADWLVVQYEVHARNVFYTVAAPQFRSDDAGQTWTEVRDTLASFPGFVGVGAIFAAPRPDVPVDRWVLAGAKRSDDVGATWQTVTGVVPDAAFIVPSGGGVSTQVGGMTGGPTLQVSCDYFQTNRPPAAAPSGNANTVIQTLGFGPAVAGGEELIAITRQGALAVRPQAWWSGTRPMAARPGCLAAPSRWWPPACASCWPACPRAACCSTRWSAPGAPRNSGPATTSRRTSRRRGPSVRSSWRSGSPWARSRDARP
jgi:hypothetical protein